MFGFFPINVYYQFVFFHDLFQMNTNTHRHIFALQRFDHVNDFVI